MGIVCLSWECRKELTGEERWETRGMRCNRRPWAWGADGSEWMNERNTTSVCPRERNTLAAQPQKEIRRIEVEKGVEKGGNTVRADTECPLSFNRWVTISREIPQRPRPSCWSISFSSNLTMAPCVLYESILICLVSPPIHSVFLRNLSPICTFHLFGREDFSSPRTFELIIISVHFFSFLFWPLFASFIVVSDRTDAEWQETGWERGWTPTPGTAT